MDSSFYLAGWLPYASSAQDLLEHMNQFQVDRAVCFPNNIPSAFDPWEFATSRSLVQLSGRVPYDRENAVLVKDVARVDERGQLLPFAMFDPGRDVPAQLDALRSLSTNLCGLKSQPTLLQSPVRHLMGDAKGLMEFAEEFDLPVLLHTSVNPDDVWSQTMDCLEVAAAYPRVRFALAHSLRFDEPSLRQARDLDNVWVDCSAHLLHCELARRDSPVVAPRGRRVDADYGSPASVMVTIYELLGGCYLWGSDSPYQSWADDDFCSVYSYADEFAVVDLLPEAVRRSMLHTGPADWLRNYSSPS